VIRYNPNTQPLVGVDIYSELCGLGLPLRFEQDLNTHALAEYHFGERCGTRRLMTAAIGAGLGAAVTLEGELVRLAGGTAGDTGHIILLPDGPECTAGCKGCAEALVSSPAVEREYALAASDPRAAHLNSQIAAGVPTARAVIRAAREGDPVAVEVFQRIGSWLGQWLASLAAIFLPEVIILCGGVSEAGEPLRNSADLRMRQLAGPEYTSGCEVITGKFRGQAGMVGAAVPLLKSLTEGERSKSK
jgi:glucokinase